MKPINTDSLPPTKSRPKRAGHPRVRDSLLPPTVSLAIYKHLQRPDQSPSSESVVGDRSNSLALKTAFQFFLVHCAFKVPDLGVMVSFSLPARKNWSCVIVTIEMVVLQLYKECLRRAKYVGHQQHNTALLVEMVRQQFKKHKHEIDPDKIQKLKDDAARGLINHMLYESEKMSGRKFSKSA
ncbi:unnamed protein product [Linum tenue]|uniref:Complex 1 LYR protein domain-containing protein n=1 Tax=Linum tenue TaxID=586396 RepID=A0AAV0RYZ2_9ROSI|nr:unnamed protein product [Linum tenue]